MLISDENIDIKCAAAKALGRINFDKALKPLKWALEQSPRLLDIRKSDVPF